MIVTALAMTLWSMTSNAQSRIAQQNLVRTVGPSMVWSVTPKSSVKRDVLKQLKTSAVQKVAAASLFDGRTFYGSMTNSNSWANVSIAAVPYGIYSFVIGDNPTPTAHITDLNYNFISGANCRGKFYGMTALSVLGALNGARYITLDTKNWKELYDKSLSTQTGGLSYSLLTSTMGYNPIDDQIYAFQYNDDLTGQYWSRFNKESQQLEEIAAFQGKYNILTLAADPAGLMYFINDHGDLYTINKTNGRATWVGNTGVSPTMYRQSMVYDGKTASFIWAAQTNDGSALYSVNPNTAEASKIMDFDNNEEFSSLYSEDNEAVNGAPAVANDLKLTYNQDGGLTGNVTLTVPTKTYDGQTLNSSILNVWVDGVNQEGVEVTPGKAVSVPVTLSEGNHYIAVNTSNDNGYSPLSYVYQYAGYDTPVKPSSVAFVSNKTAGKDTVTWKAPETGLNAGYIDKANLKYTVVRMPDSVTVASGYNKTSFVEDIPAMMHNYFYRVYAVNNGKTSDYSESNQVICGKAFSIPYSQNFTNASTLSDFFTVVDGNNDHNTWRNGYKEARIDISKYTTKNGDDWLITPAITLKGGNKYRFTANLRTYAAGYYENFKVFVGTNSKDTTTFRQVDDVEKYQSYNGFSDHNSDFSIDKDGDYYLAIKYCGDTLQHSSMIRLNSVSVNKIGAIGAPESVSDLKVNPDANDALAATVSFTAPTKDLNGDVLSSISKIDVLRNNETAPIHTFTSPAVGADLSWTDTAVPNIGMNTYKVVASNDKGEGQSASASAFVGVYTTPYIENFATKAAADLYTVNYKGVPVNNNYGWSYNANKYMDYSVYVTGDSISNAWLFTPAIKLDKDGVYNVTYKAKIYESPNTIVNKIYAGLSPDPEKQNILLGDMPNSTKSAYHVMATKLITADAGKYYIGFNSILSHKSDYVTINLDSIAVTYLKSAKSPYVITNYKSQADVTGAVKTTLSFNAPAVDYQGNPLTELSKVDIYRGESSIPVKTFSAPAPGAALSWEDDQPIHGINHYLIVATNSEGRGEAYLDTLYVGRDVPTSVNDFELKASDDNADGILTWKAPTGKNGGVIVPSELSYNVYQYDAKNNTFTLVGSNLKDCTFTASRSTDTQQSVYYYGVAPVNTEGVGDTLVHSVVLGKLYQMPFKESFANDALSTSPWLIKTSNSSVLNWGITNPEGKTDSQGQLYNNATAQDGDGGCAYMYNGNYYSIYGGASFFTPKMTLGGNSDILSFWVYNIATKYPAAKPIVVVKVCPMDGNMEQLGDTIVVGGSNEDGWKHYTLSMDKYKDTKYLYISFEAYTDGHSDVIYLDNVVVGNETETGINSVGTDEKAVKLVNYYDLDGREVVVPGRGVFIKTTTYKDGTKKSMKFVNR
jgi:hypothetical protein